MVTGNYFLLHEPSQIPLEATTSHRQFIQTVCFTSNTGNACSWLSSTRLINSLSRWG